MSKANINGHLPKLNGQCLPFRQSDDLVTIKTVASAWMALYPESDYPTKD
jgi:hypothetical protein